MREELGASAAYEWLHVSVVAGGRAGDLYISGRRVNLRRLADPSGCKAKGLRFWPGSPGAGRNAVLVGRASRSVKPEPESERRAINNARVISGLLSAFVLLCACGSCERKDAEQPQAKTLKVGCISILSRDVATYGKETKQGIDLAMEEANASGKLGDKRIMRALAPPEERFLISSIRSNRGIVPAGRFPLFGGSDGPDNEMAVNPMREKSVAREKPAASDRQKIRPVQEARPPLGRQRRPSGVPSAVASSGGTNG